MTLAVLRCPDTLCWQFYLKIGFCIFKSWNQPFRCQSFADGKGWICKTLFHFADFTRWLREYSEHWKICWIQWKDFDWEKMEGKNDSLAAHLIFRARGSDEHFLLTRTQLHTGEGRAPSLSFKCSENIWSGINIWCTGWSLKTVDCIFFLTDPKTPKNAITQRFLESWYREILIFCCFKTVRCVEFCLSELFQ